MNFPNNLQYSTQQQILTQVQEDFPQLLVNNILLDTLIECNDIVKYHLILKAISENISQDNSQTIWLMNTQPIPFLISIIEKNISFQITYDASQILLNMATGTDKIVRQLVKYGVLDVFLCLLNYEDERIINQGLWGIANLVAQSDEITVYLLNNNLIPKIFEAQRKLINKSNLFWLIDNLCKTRIGFIELIPIISEFILTNPFQPDNPQLINDLTNCVSALSSISLVKKSFKIILSINGLLRTLKQLMYCNIRKIQIGTQRIFGSLSTGTDEQCFQLLQIGYQKVVLDILKEGKDKILMKEGLEILSNFCCNSNIQVEMIYFEYDMVNQIFKIVQENKVKSVVTKALLVLFYSLSSGSESTILFLFNSGLHLIIIQHIQFVYNKKQAVIILNGLRKLNQRNFQSIKFWMNELFKDNSDWFNPLLFDYGPFISELSVQLIESIIGRYRLWRYHI